MKRTKERGLSFRVGNSYGVQQLEEKTILYKGCGYSFQVEKNMYIFFPCGEDLEYYHRNRLYVHRFTFTKNQDFNH